MKKYETREVRAEEAADVCNKMDAHGYDFVALVGNTAPRTDAGEYNRGALAILLFRRRNGIV